LFWVRLGILLQELGEGPDNVRTFGTAGKITDYKLFTAQCC